MAQKVGCNLKNQNSDDYLTLYFRLVCRTVGDADTLEIMRCTSNFNCNYYSFFSENENKAKQLINIAAKHLKHGWPDYEKTFGKKRNELSFMKINGKTQDWFNPDAELPQLTNHQDSDSKIALTNTTTKTHTPRAVKSLEPKHIGLLNSDNRCYLNAGLQFLLHMSDNFEFKEDDADSNSTIHTLFKTIQSQLVDRTTNMKELSDNVAKLRDAMCQGGTTFKRGQQEDAHEAVMKLFNSIAFSDCLGKNSTQLGNNPNAKIEPYRIVELGISQGINNLGDLLARYLKPEEMDDFKVDGNLSQMTKTTSLIPNQKILFQLNRFKFNKQTNTSSKIKPRLKLTPI